MTFCHFESTLTGLLRRPHYVPNDHRSFLFLGKFTPSHLEYRYGEGLWPSLLVLLLGSLISSRREF